MQKLMGQLRRCIEDYHMIEEGDRIAVGVSGGKDSLTLLYLLAQVREYYPKRFALEALSIDMGLGGMDFRRSRRCASGWTCRTTAKKRRSGRSFLTTEKRKIPARCARRCAEAH